MLRLQFHTHLKEWYQDLIKPIDHLLPKSPDQTVTFIPDGPMSMLPFAIFEKQDGKYFIEDHPTLMAPSIKAVSLLGQLKKQRNGRVHESVVIGNPITTLRNLPHAEEEAIKVSALLKAPSNHKMIGKDATISSFLNLMENAKWIHFKKLRT